MEEITLDIDEPNDLAFKIKMEGATQTEPAKARLVCEGTDFSYMFNGYATEEIEVVQFTLPQMAGKLKEGTYEARVEVLVENRYFVPVKFQVNFKKTLSVVAESVVVKPKENKQELKVTAEPIVVVKKPLLQPQPQVQFEQKKATQTETSVVNVKTKSTLREEYEKSVSKRR